MQAGCKGPGHRTRIVPTEEPLAKRKRQYGKASWPIAFFSDFNHNGKSNIKPLTNSSKDRHYGCVAFPEKWRNREHLFPFPQTSRHRTERFWQQMRCPLSRPRLLG